MLKTIQSFLAPYVLYLVVTLAVALGAMTWRAEHIKDEWVKRGVQLGIANQAIADANKNIINGNTIASIAADACKSSITVHVQQAREAEGIRNAANTPGGANAAYNSLMCQRPEAAGHPACAVSGKPVHD